MPRLILSDTTLPRAERVLARERRRLDGVVVGELLLTGGSSLPGLLTAGDIDLHLRTAAGEFASAVERLRGLYEVVHAEIWTENLATFAVPNDEVELAVTPAGSEHDKRFTLAWRRLRDDPELRGAYNDVKRLHASADEGTYRAAKAKFFDEITELDPA